MKSRCANRVLHLKIALEAFEGKITKSNVWRQTKEIKLKVAIMGAKGYPTYNGGYDTLIRELGEPASSNVGFR